MTSHERKADKENALKGGTALITGAGRRIGRALAIALAEEGIHVVAHDRKAQEAETEAVCSEVVACGAKSWKVIAELEKPEEYGSLVSRAIEAAGSLDIVINNASQFLPDTVMNAGFENMVRQLHVNAWAPFVVTREFARLAGRGSVINLLDTKIAGHDPDHFSYILSKHLLSVISSICALEFAPAIRVNAVAPGLILPPAGKDERYLELLSPTVPLNRHGGTEDIEEAVLFLLRSEFVTGQIVFVDGGRHLVGGGQWTAS
jgi:hypothetical protein